MNLEKQYEASQRARMNLKESLVRQIEEKERTKKEQRIRDRMDPYTEDQFKRIHHPINNPVDFKVTHDNRYIIKELSGGN